MRVNLSICVSLSFVAESTNEWVYLLNFSECFAFFFLFLFPFVPFASDSTQ